MIDDTPVMDATQPAPMAPAIGPEQLRKLTETLKKYKSGKTQTELRILASENWWKLRNSAEEKQKSATVATANFQYSSSWTHNVLTNKHADGTAAYPEPNARPREEGDKAEAAILSSIIPCILEQNDFEQTYSDVEWQKCKTGTGVYKVTWDQDKLNGLGDISISRVNLLNLYWEPGITDIQKSRYFFHCELEDKDLLEEQYPQLKGKLGGQEILMTKFLYDDNVSTDDKVTVVECYYHKFVNGKRTLQHVRYVNDVVLSATENDPMLSARGLYDHGMYPYFFDALFPIEGSPCGYGYVDICKNPQMAIDMLNTTFVKNAMAGATPRYFRRVDGGVNEEQFLDLTKTLVDVNGNLGEDSLRQINFQPLDSIYVNFLDRTIQELRETSGNTETATGTTSQGVTAAAAIAALQEASGKISKDATEASYRVYGKLITMVIELIRQFYDLPRQFRITGRYGAERFVTYTNEHLKPQPQGMAFGQDMGYRLPVFDIQVSAQKKSVYTKVAQNELALQFFQLGFFNPQMADQALMCLDMMDFDGKDMVMQKIEQNGTMFEKLAQYMQLALQLAATAAPEMVPGLSNDIMQTMGGGVPAGGAMPSGITMPKDSTKPDESTHMQKARAQSQQASQPDGGAVTGGARG